MGGACMGKKRNACKVLVGIQKKRDHLEEERTILKWILDK
jgi:hypothetical protein